MKLRQLSNWDDPSKCVGLVYFAQIVEEMLFDYTLDTYKASVMHTGLLCAEGLQTIEEIENGNIKAPNLRHITDELCSCYKKDLVALSLVTLPSSAFFSTLKNQKSGLNEVRTVLELLSIQLSASKYKKRNEELLIQEIKGSQTISTIRGLARSYITTLIAVGFHPKHIQSECINFFYKGDNRVTGDVPIGNFLSLFSKEKTEFTVIFRTGKIFEQISGVFPEEKLLITHKLPEQIDLSSYPAFSQQGGLYAIAQQISARDIFSARNSAESILKLAATLLTIYHHKENPNWISECIVQDATTKIYSKIANPINSMQKCADLIPAVASNRLKLLVQEFSLDKDSFAKFVRSAQLHSMALGSNTDENQILNLWISLESLIPSESKGEDISNIEHIVNSLIPFLNIGYVEGLLNCLVKDLLTWNATDTRKALKKIEGRKFIDRLAKGLILADCAPSLASLESQLHSFPLLHDRFEYLKYVLTSPTNVVNALDAHKTRLEWQIRRIYRTRNIIVHSGKTPPYTKTLIEHTHGYLDIVLSALVKMASKPKVIHSVGQGFKYANLQYDTYYKALSQKGLSFDGKNIDALLFLEVNRGINGASIETYPTE